MVAVVKMVMVVVVEVTVVMAVVMVSTVYSGGRPQHAHQPELMKDLIKFPNLEMLTLVGRLKVKWISRWEPEISEGSGQGHDGSLH